MHKEKDQGTSTIARRPGNILPLDNLPSPNTKRWVVRHKAEVVDAIRNGLLSLEEACGRYALSLDELISWQVAYNRYGLNGLRARRAQSYRRAAHHSPDGLGYPPTS